MEKDIERYLKTEIEKLGGMSLKWVCPGNDGVPDRIVIMPGGLIWFVELKTDRGKIGNLQLYWWAKLTDLGCHAYIAHGKEGVKALIDTLKKDYGYGV